LKASSLALDGRLKPLSLRTNCSDEAWISSSVAGGLKFQFAPLDAGRGGERITNNVDDPRVRKNFEPGGRKKRRARFLPTPHRAEFQSRAQPEPFDVVSITKNVAEVLANIAAQIIDAIALTLGRFKPIEKWLGLVPGCTDTAKIIFMQ